MAVYLPTDDLTFLARLFPVLQRFQPVKEAFATGVTGISEQEQRWRGFGALRALLRNLCARQRVVVSIDDLQWAGSDSWQLLAELVREPDAPRFLLIGTQRGGVASDRENGEKDTYLWPGERRVVKLGGLEDYSARVLITKLLPGNVAEDRAQALVAESDGHPLFLAELCHFVHTHEDCGSLRLEHALRTKLGGLDPDQRSFLEIVALAGVPLPHKTAVLAANLPGYKVEETLQRLVADRLLQTQGMGAADAIEPYHACIRATILAHLEPKQRTSLHASLAVALEQSPVTDAQLIATHWQGAGKFDRARTLWIRAADEAAETLAFDRAARLYGDALGLLEKGDADWWILSKKLGQVLANAGRGAEAARAYQDAAARAPATEVATLRHLAGEQLLRSGHIDEGIATLGPLFKEKGIVMPSSPRQALIRFLRARIRLKLTRPRLGFRLRDESLVPQEYLSKMDLCWAAMIGLFNFDRLRGLLFHTQHLSMALQAGEPFRIARGLAVEALVLTGSGASSDRVQATLDRAREIGRGMGRPYLDAFFELLSGSVAFFQGRWPGALAHHQRAREEFHANCTGITWELNTIRLVAGIALFFHGRLGDLSREVNKAVQEGRQRGDFYARLCTLGVPNVVWLMEDDVEGARRNMEIISEWSQKGFHIPHLFYHYSQVQADLYVGDWSQAFQRLVSIWPRVTSSGLLRLEIIRVLMLDLRARTALAKALVVEFERGKLPHTFIHAQTAKRNAQVGAMVYVGTTAMVSGHPTTDASIRDV